MYLIMALDRGTMLNYRPAAFKAAERILFSEDGGFQPSSGGLRPAIASRKHCAWDCALVGTGTRDGEEPCERHEIEIQRAAAT